MKTVTYTREQAEQLRTAYNKAVEEGKEVFTFNGHKYYVGYAKYLLEFLDAQFKRG